MFKHAKIYGGSDPKLEEENIFRATVLLGEIESTDQAILDFSQEAKSANEIMQFLNLKPLLEKGLLKETLLERLTSSKQEYVKIGYLESSHKEIT